MTAPKEINGAIAQLGERNTGSVEVGGSIPPSSTIKKILSMNLLEQKINFSWQLFLVLFLLISPMFFGPLIALFNPEFFEGLGDKELSLGSTLFVARNLAIGLAFLFAIYMRSASMLFILILVRLIIDLIDFPAFQIFREPSLFGQIIIFSLMCYLPAYFGLRILWKEIKNPS